MKKLTEQVLDAAKALEQISREYAKQVAEDHLSGLMHRWYKAALRKAKVSAVETLSEVTPPLITIEHTLYFRHRGKLLKWTRIATNVKTVDIDEIRTDASLFLENFRESVDEYVQRLCGVNRFSLLTQPMPPLCASLPQLAPRAENYKLQWFLWGMKGTLVDKDKLPHLLRKIKGR